MEGARLLLLALLGLGIPAYGAEAPPAAAGAAATNPPAVDEAEAAAIGVMEAFMLAFNARDEVRWADTLHFPHVRLASGAVTVHADREDFLEAMDLDQFAQQTGWNYSTWDNMRVIQASPEKVHIAVKFTRYDRQGELIASYQSLYVVEKLDGRWGIRARSSFAP